MLAFDKKATRLSKIEDRINAALLVLDALPRLMRAFWLCVLCTSSEYTSPAVTGDWASVSTDPFEL